MHPFCQIALKPSSTVEVMSERFYGSSLREDARLLELLKEPPDQLGVQQLRAGGVEGFLYFLFYFDRRQATRACLQLGSARALTSTLRYTAGSGYLVISESEKIADFHSATGHQLGRLESPFNLDGLEEENGAGCTALFPTLPSELSIPLLVSHAVSTEFRIREAFSRKEGKLSMLDKLRGMLGRSPVPFHPAPLDADQVVGQAVQEYTGSAGTYGMGGPGFLGFRLSDDWLVIAIWGAEDWVELEGKVLSEHPRDEFTARLVGATLTDLSLTAKNFSMRLSSGALLEIREKSLARPAFDGTGLPRELSAQDDLRQGIFLAPTVEIWV